MRRYNYLIDYALVNGGLPGRPTFAQLLGLDAGGEKIFYYQYPTCGCNTAYNSIPIHLENTKFPTVGPQALNLSTRGNVSSGDDVLIGGFIITGTEPKSVVLRALGPSLSGFGVSDVLADPVLSLYNSSRHSHRDQRQLANRSKPLCSRGQWTRASQSIGIGHFPDLAAGRLYCDSQRKGPGHGDRLGRALRSLAAIQL